MDMVIVTNNGLMDQEWFGYSWLQVYEANMGSNVLLKIQLRGDNWNLLAEETIGNCHDKLTITNYYQAFKQAHGRINKTSKDTGKEKTNTIREGGLFG